MLALFAKKSVRATVIAGSILFAASANAVVFSNINITGTAQLIAGASWNITGDEIDFTFTNAIVGDNQALRQGNIVITYWADSAAPLVMDRLVLNLLGGVAGSGFITVSELIEDRNTGLVLGTLPTTVITNNSQLPFTADIHFNTPSAHIKVKKEFFLSAQDTPAFDMARIGLVEQKLFVVPEPATMAVLGLGVVPFLRRRKK